MVLNIDAKSKGKLTCAFKIDMKNLANFHQNTFENLKIGNLMGSFYPKQKCMSLKFIGELCLMTIKNDLKFEGKLTCHFEIDMRNLANFDRSTRKSKKCAL